MEQSPNSSAMEQSTNDKTTINKNDETTSNAQTHQE